MSKILPPVLTLFAVLLFCTSGYTQPIQRAILKGTVRDVQGAVVPNAVVTIANKNGTHQAATSAETGEYYLSVQPGIYKVFVEPKMGFVTAHHSEIKLESSTRVLNFRVYGPIVVLTKYKDQRDEEVMEHPAMKLSNFEYQEIPNLSETDIRNGMVRFATKSESLNLTVYEGDQRPSEKTGVTFTYDFFTVIADELRYEPKTKDIFAVGHVVIEIGDKTDLYTGVVKIRVADGKVTYQPMDAKRHRLINP